MHMEHIADIENFWTGVVEGSITDGKTIIRVPLHGLGRQTAAKLAARLHIMVFIKGTDYLFTTSLQELLEDERKLQ